MTILYDTIIEFTQRAETMNPVLIRDRIYRVLCAEFGDESVYIATRFRCTYHTRAEHEYTRDVTA